MSETWKFSYAPNINIFKYLTENWKNYLEIKIRYNQIKQDKKIISINSSKDTPNSISDVNEIFEIMNTIHLLIVLASYL